jgi:hypothetical protein
LLDLRSGCRRGQAYTIRTSSGISDISLSGDLQINQLALPEIEPVRQDQTGTAMLTQTATWLREHLRPVPGAATACG